MPLKKHSYVKMLPAYSSETHSRSIIDQITGLVCQIAKEADAHGFVDVTSSGINAGYTEVNVHKDRCVPFARYDVKVTLPDGSTIETPINGSREAITVYYAKNFHAAKVEFLEDSGEGD